MTTPSRSRIDGGFPLFPGFSPNYLVFPSKRLRSFLDQTLDRKWHAVSSFEFANIFLWEACNSFDLRASPSICLRFVTSVSYNASTSCGASHLLETTTATPAVSALCVASHFSISPGGRTSTRQVTMWAVRIRHVRRLHPHVGRLILLRGAATCVVFDVGLHNHPAARHAMCLSLSTCASASTPIVHFCIVFLARCAQPEREGGDTASTPVVNAGETFGPRWSALSAPRLHHRRKKSASHAHLSASFVHDAQSDKISPPRLLLACQNSSISFATMVTTLSSVSWSCLCPCRAEFYLR